MLLEVRKGLLGIGRHQHADHQSHSHDGGANARGARVVDRLEVDVEGQLLVWGLQGVSTPLVARGGDDAGCPDGKPEDHGLVREGGRSNEVLNAGACQPTGPAVDDVAGHCGDVGLSQSSKGKLV